jgi:MerR family transcriptional regulator, light-induced transcriptional regulator
MTDAGRPAPAGPTDRSDPAASNGVAQLKDEFEAAILNGSLAAARLVVRSAVARGLPGANIYAEVLSPALCDIGELWEQNRISIADEHLATAITSRVMAIVSDSLASGADASNERLVITGVEGEQHVMGLRMIADVLEGAGYDVLFLGVDTPASALVASIARHRPDLVALGATGPGSGERLTGTITALRQIAPALPIVVGGSQARLAAQVLGDSGVHVAEDATTVVAVVRSAIACAGISAPGDQAADR